MKRISTTILLLSFSLTQFSSTYACEPEATVKAAKLKAEVPAVLAKATSAKVPAANPALPVAPAKASTPAEAAPPQPAVVVKPAVAKPAAAKQVPARPAAAKSVATKPVVAKAEATKPAVAEPVEAASWEGGVDETTQQDPRAAKILNEMSKKYQNLKAYSATFTQTLENPGAKIKETMKGDIVVMGNKFKLSMNGQEVINNGSTIWTYMKNENEVNISDYDPSEEEISPTAIYNMYKKGYKYTFVKEEKRGGQTYEVIELTPEDRNNPVFKVELVINKADKSLDSWKMFRNNGNRYTYNITKFVPNPTVAAADFNFDKAKYKGVKVIDLR